MTNQYLLPKHTNFWGRSKLTPLPLYDRWFVFATVSLISIGLLMVASSTIVIANQFGQNAFYYVIRQFIYLSLGMLAAFFCIRINTQRWQQMSGWLLIVCLLLLCLVLIPGIGRSVKGSMRWLGIGPFGIQASEFAKLAVIIYLAGFFVRSREKLLTQISSLLVPTLVVTLVAYLLLKEPDFGTATLIIFTSLTIFYLAGGRVSLFISVMILVVSALLLLAISSPYRLARLTAFLDPWQDQFGSGYQLTQSLIAFGRGGLFGIGLGNSIQKLFYLPEAHTDFLIAILAEEFGLVGVLIVIFLFAVLITRGFIIARGALLNDLVFQGFMAYGLTLCLGLQAIINIGVNIGVLPTKGLTLPLMSYGGNSLLVSCIMIGLLLRIDHELRWQVLGLTPRGK